MSAIILFMCGIVVGAIYEKTILDWKSKALKATQAAKDVFKN
jgi:hypothetical protein